jgi:hypothetical protein
MADQNEEEHVARIVYPEIKEDDSVLYANSFQVNHTPWDFALHFGQVVVPTRPSGTDIKARGVAVINVPVPLIKGLIKALEINVAAYEKSYGAIAMPTKGVIEDSPE